MATAWQNEMAQAQQDSAEESATYWFPIVHNDTRGLVYDAGYDNPRAAIRFAEAVKTPSAFASTARRATAAELCESHNTEYPDGITWSVVMIGEITEQARGVLIEYHTS